MSRDKMTWLIGFAVLLVLPTACLAGFCYRVSALGRLPIGRSVWLAASGWGAFVAQWVFGFFLARSAGWLYLTVVLLFLSMAIGILPPLCAVAERISGRSIGLPILLWSLGLVGIGAVVFTAFMASQGWPGW